MPVALITPESQLHKPDEPYVRILQEAGFEVLYPDEPTFTRGQVGEAEAIRQLSVCDAIIAGGEYFTAVVLENLPRLRVIARSGVGYDRVDVEAATKHNIPVCITPNGNYECVAEQALAHMFAVAKSMHYFDREMRAGRWTRYLTLPLRGKTLGIVGLGRIGRALAVRAIALGMRVIAHETFPQEAFLNAHDVKLMELDAVLAQADFVSAHCPANDETHGMFNASLFGKMKEGSIFINTARGALVVEEDLLAALQSGHLGGAGLDVYQEEPPATDHAFYQLDNVSLTPHTGGEDELASEMMGTESAENIVNLYRGQWPEGNVINNELRDGWQWDPS